MVSFNIGDKVKFLNDKGGGVVTGIVDTRMVKVTDENGFELPVLISELVRIEPDNAAGRFFNEEFVVPGMKTGEQPAEPDDPRQNAIPSGLRKNPGTGDIYLAFIPHDQRWLMTGLMDIRLINHTTLDVLYSIFLKRSSGETFGKDYGSIFPDSSLLIDTVEREALAEWESGTLQFLFHTDAPGEVLPPFNAGFRISGKKFFSEGSYRESPFYEGKGFLVRVVSLATLRPAAKPPVQQGKPVSGKESLPLISRHRTEPREAVVDLHIHELVEDSSNLETGEILEIQKGYFERCMESAFAEHYRKVTFIHGVGNGTLRRVLQEMLEKYEGIGVSDAPMALYGRGALEIRLQHNR